MLLLPLPKRFAGTAEWNMRHYVFEHFLQDLRVMSLIWSATVLDLPD